MDDRRPIFDRQALASEYGISDSMLDNITKQARKEFGDDDMMVELHIMRAIRCTRFDTTTKTAEA